MVRSFTPEFGVTWEDPEYANHVWAIDRNHFPHPMPPLGQELVKALVEKSWEKQVAFVNGYLYIKDYGPPPIPPEVAERGGLAVWKQDYLPVVKDICAGLRRVTDGPLVALADALPGLFDRAALAFRDTTVVAGPILRPGLELASFCYDEMGDEGAVLAGSVLQGFANESANAGMELEKLADLASSLPAVSSSIKAGQFGDLEDAEGGPAFLERFNSFLDRYGWRAENWSLPHVPTWAEEPSIPLGLVGRYLNDREHSPSASIRRAIELREAASREIEGRLRPEARDRYRQLLAAAQSHVAVSEERAMWQLLIVGNCRAPIMALGRKFVAAAVIEEANDIFFLSPAEIRDSAHEPRDRNDVVRARKTDLEDWKRLSPPTSVALPLVIPEGSTFSQMMRRFFFGTAVVGEGPGERTLKGNGASAGVARGKARIIQSLNESERLERGEVLVCRATSPPWTPLFAVAGAVVTETGGVLSHSAICAREYAIPCVVGAAEATTKIRDGAMVTVDGTKGTVVIEEG
jgi:phosphohistidine swiveling domain-containing protein